MQDSKSTHHHLRNGASAMQYANYHHYWSHQQHHVEIGLQAVGNLYPNERILTSHRLKADSASRHILHLEVGIEVGNALE